MNDVIQNIDLGHHLDKLDIIFSMFAILIGLYFTHLVDSIKLLFTSNLKFKFSLAHILTTITVLFAAIQFIWSFDYLQYNLWHKNSYYKELINFMYLLLRTSMFYLLGLFLHPSNEDLKDSDFLEDNNSTFSSQKYYNSKKTIINILIILYLVLSIFSNYVNIFSNQSFLKQLISKIVLITLIVITILIDKKNKLNSNSIKLKKVGKVLDILNPILCLLMIIFYLVIRGEIIYKEMNVQKTGKLSDKEISQ